MSSPLAFALLALVALTVLVLAPERFAWRRRDDDLRQLIRAVRGDRDQAARLVAYERKLAPTIGTDEATRRALTRLERDRSR